MKPKKEKQKNYKMPHSAHHPIPNLFPDTLELICTNAILNNLTTSGKKIEKEAKWILSNENSFSNFGPSEDSTFYRTHYFEGCVNMARDFLVSFLASHLLNKLSSTLATPTGNIFIWVPRGSAARFGDLERFGLLFKPFGDQYFAFG